MTSRKVEVGLKRRWELSKRRLGWRLAWWGSTAKKEALHLRGLRARHQYSDQRSNQNRAFCVASTASRDQGRGGPNSQIVSIKRAADGRRQISREIIYEEKEKYRAKNEFLQNIWTDLKGSDFCDFDKPYKRAY